MSGCSGGSLNESTIKYNRTNETNKYVKEVIDIQFVEN
jgi:hypothetical protein